jgi:predicted N-formylglutamate amidohydrolase
MPRPDRRPPAGRRGLAVVVSCEHGGNLIPARYRSLFTGARRVLASHRGWDPGAIELARAVARACRAPLVASTTSRLLVECNRSIGHPRLFSEFTRGLPAPEKRRLLDSHYRPHRRAVEAAVRARMRGSARVVHVGVHTFTPIWKGARRPFDVGILYDPRSDFEAAVADALIVHLALEAPHLRVRRNAPYRGWTDGLTTTLRGMLRAERYAGIEIEVNQALARDRSASGARTLSAVALAVGHALR